MKTELKGSMGKTMAAKGRYAFPVMFLAVAVLAFGAALDVPAGDNMSMAGNLAVFCMVGLILCTNREHRYKV